jgi:hypothetical protein
VVADVVTLLFEPPPAPSPLVNPEPVVNPALVVNPVLVVNPLSVVEFAVPDAVSFVLLAVVRVLLVAALVLAAVFAALAADVLPAFVLLFVLVEARPPEVLSAVPAALVVGPYEFALSSEQPAESAVVSASKDIERTIEQHIAS